MEFFSFFFFEGWAFWVGVQALEWLIVVSFDTVPAIDPYIPRAKRPPAYLALILQWVNATIDATADLIAPCIRLRACSGHKATCSKRFPSSLRVHAGAWIPIRPVLNYCALWPSLHQSLVWRSRLRDPPDLAICSSVQVGLARASSVASNREPGSARTIFDSDSFDILVDGGATSCISNSLSDFIKPPLDSKVRVQGFNGTSSSTKVGTVRWTVLDDTGHRRSLEIPGTYYIPACPMRLLSPQHYSQATRDHRGTYSTNFGDHVLFVWNHGQFRATLPLSSHTNVGLLRSAPGHLAFTSFVSDCCLPCPSFFTSTVVTDDEGDAIDSESEDDISLSAPAAANVEGGTEDENDFNVDDIQGQSHATPSEPSQRPHLVPFDLDHDDPATNLPSTDDAVSSLDAPSELLRWHYRLGHLPFANIRLMAAKGEIPKRMTTCKIPKCQSCLYGRATRRPWRTKGQTSQIRTVTKPGGCVSVDQLESPVPGFIGQNKGGFFRKRYKVATIFVDHFSRLSFVHLQESTKGEETLMAKRAFEAYAASFGVKVTNYHADNGRFAERLFLDHAELHGQTVSLCGVNAHFQNGIAEKRIRDLTERARTSLLHGMSRWPSAVTVNLWPYALRYANEVHNATPSVKSGLSPLEIFSVTPVRPQVLNFHPPFCPVYVLHNGLQGGGKRPNKWVRRSRIAVYLGSSPRHARSVALVLSLTTGYVSPQFHLKFDDFFETVQEPTTLPVSSWQKLARFETHTDPQRPSSILHKGELLPFHPPIEQAIPRCLKMLMETRSSKKLLTEALTFNSLRILMHHSWEMGRESYMESNH